MGAPMLKNKKGYKLTLSQIKNSGRWRWKFAYCGRVLAAAYHTYASRSAAHLAFDRMVYKASGLSGDYAIDG